MDMNPYTSRSSWSVGIDIGQAADPTAVCAVESVRWQMSERFERAYHHKSGAWPRDPVVLDAVAKKPHDELHVRALKRLALGTSYPEQCQQLGVLLATPQLVGAPVFLDAGGVGKPVSDLFKRGGIKHTPIWITAGRDEQPHGDGFTVPKLHLISRLQAALHSGELKIAKSLPEANAFVRELQEFRDSFTESGHLQFGARQGAHDDLVLAAALAVYGTNRPKPMMDLRIPFAS
jgi:hypothetical protein